MYLTGVDVTAVDTTIASGGNGPQFDLGSKYMADDGLEYKYVELKNTTATVAVAAGDVLGYGLAGIASNIVVSDNSDSQTKPIGAGVAQATIAGTLATSYYCWVQTGGAFTANQTLAGTPADGDALFLSTTDKTLTLSTAADDPICAYADDASADLCIAAFAR
jgi:hypothetical protein